MFVYMFVHTCVYCVYVCMYVCVLCGVGANGQQNYTVTIVANPNTAPYTVGDTLMLTCMVDPMPKSTVTYQWQCFDCFANGVTAQHITKVLTDMDNDMIDCSVTIDNMEYFNEMMFDLQVTQGSHNIYYALCMKLSYVCIQCLRCDRVLIN